MCFLRFLCSYSSFSNLRSLSHLPSLLVSLSRYPLFLHCVIYRCLSVIRGSILLPPSRRRRKRTIQLSRWIKQCRRRNIHDDSLYIRLYIIILKKISYMTVLSGISRYIRTPGFYRENRLTSPSLRNFRIDGDIILF